MEKVTNKLASWKGRLLKKLGRINFANSILTTIPSYIMQIYVWRVILLKLICNFIWKGLTNKGLKFEYGWLERGDQAPEVRWPRGDNILKTKYEYPWYTCFGHVAF